ncbi:hypothetical protein E2C01_009422 [Portunus trituberculatus]|uniref:Uncharacterized protein n=1 Tax=Portunus trituberculatus TaxID=210409 RepID=A0A5B7D5S6_PORTR|nr:hypothetical protein [Portunus trituberculatus]
MIAVPHREGQYGSGRSLQHINASRGDAAHHEPPQHNTSPAAVLLVLTKSDNAFLEKLAQCPATAPSISPALGENLKQQTKCYSLFCLFIAPRM